jgi:pimeloyl-ACP methyl ester carboxylesterase
MYKVHSARIRAALAALAAMNALIAAAHAQTPPPPTAPGIAGLPIEHADWTKDENWLCLPGRQDACTLPLDAAVVAPNGSVKIETFKLAANPAIDCFYVYPTVSLDNFSTSDLVAGVEERAVIERQFARLSSVCRPYAPMYRQTTLPQLRAGQGSSEAPPKRGAQGQGTADVDAAWEHYLKNHNQGRGVVLIGHSQGAGQISRLVRTKIEGTPTQKHIVAVYILGGSVTVPKGQEVGGTFKSISACKSRDQVGCVVTYGSFRATIPPNPTGQAVGAGPGTGSTGNNHGVCVNPAALIAGKSNGPAIADSYWQVEPPIGATTKSPPRWSKKETIYQSFAKTPGLVTTECVDKNNRTYLQVTINANANDARADDVYGDVMTASGPNAGWGLHNLDVPLHMGDIVKLVGYQAKAYANTK